MTDGSSCPSVWSTRCDQGEERHNTMRYNAKIIFKYSINRLVLQFDLVRKRGYGFKETKTLASSVISKIVAVILLS